MESNIHQKYRQEIYQKLGAPGKYRHELDQTCSSAVGYLVDLWIVLKNYNLIGQFAIGLVGTTINMRLINK